MIMQTLFASRKSVLLLGCSLFMVLGLAGAIFWLLVQERKLDEGNKIVSAISHSLNEHILTHNSKCAQAISKHPIVIQALGNKDNNGNQELKTVLSTALIIQHASIVYLMNHQGTVIADAWAQKDKTFVGKNYAFRPYFQIPLKQSKPTIYAALGVTTNKRGMYFSSPVFDPKGKFAGVVVIKMGLDAVDRMMRKQDLPCALVSPEGIVFASNQPEWLFRSTIKLDNNTREDLRKSRQFADQPLQPLGLNLHKQFITYNGHNFTPSITPIDLQDWELIVLNNATGFDHQLIITIATIGIMFVGLVLIAVYFFLKRQKSIAELRENEERFRTIFDTALAGMVLINAENHEIVDANPMALKLIGAPREEVIGHVCHKFICPAEQGKCPITDLGETVDSSERTLITADGREIPVLKTVTMADFGERKCIIDSFLDLVNVKQAQAEKEQLEKRLRMAEKLEAIGQLAGGVAHEFNNQLAIINGFTEMVYNKINDNKLKKKLDKVLVAGRRSTNLTRQLLNYSRKGDSKTEKTSFNVIIRDIQAILQAILPSEIEIKYNLEPELGEIICDPSLLSDVILNLCNNARDAMPDGGTITITTANIELDENDIAGFPESTPGAYTCLTVTDTGHGMDAETRSHIFDPFFTTKKVGKGTGLGLSMAHGAVLKCKGVIRVTSEVGKGTTFNIMLPRL